MPKFTDKEQEILAALEIYDSAGDVAAVTGAPLRQVIHLQRLYGSRREQQIRAEEDRKRLREIMESARASQWSGHPDSKKGASPFGSYWRAFGQLEVGLPVLPRSRQQPRRVARMVPDDRSEELDFDMLMNAVLGGIQRAQEGIA